MKGQWKSRVVLLPVLVALVCIAAFALGEVTSVVRNPGQTVPSKKGREVRQSLAGVRGRLLLRVVVRETNVAYHVVTAYKTSKVSKYWIPP